MNRKSTGHRRPYTLPTTVVALALVALSSTAAAEQVRVELSGTAEAPPVETKAAGSGVINIGVDNSITGEVHTSGVIATMAHIHEGASGKSGPVIIPLIRESNDSWMVPPNTKLTEEQMKAFKAGDLYVNVHSAAHPAGEIRGQLKP